MDVIYYNYAICSILIGAIITIENFLLLKSKGKFDANADGKAKGKSFFFMIVGMFWLGVSVATIVKGVHVYLALLYVLPAVLSLFLGVKTNLEEGVVLEAPIWQVRMNVVLSISFLVCAIITTQL